MPTSLPPGERVLRARIAAHTRWSRHNADDALAKVRASGPAGGVEWFFDEVDPERRLSEPERRRRAESARKAYYIRLALLSVKARRQRGAS